MDLSIFDDLVIVKRSGQRVSFNGTKIAIAIKKAFDSVYDSSEKSVNKVYGKVLDYIKDNYKDRKTINVEDIQDIIEKVLKEEKYIEVYYAFNNYRLKRASSREIFDRKQQHKFIRATEKLVLTAQNEKNINPIEQLFSFGKTISVEFSKAYLLESKYVRNHDEGNIHIHDLDYYVLATTASTHLDLSNIDDYSNYFEKITEMLFGFKEEQYKEHSFPSFDYVIEPYILYEFKKILKKKVVCFFEIEGFSNLVNIKGIELLIDKLDDIYIDIDTFSKYLPNNKVKTIFELSYKYSIEDLEEEIYNEIKKMLLHLNNIPISINNNTGYSISLGTNNSNIGKFINKVYLKVISNLEYIDVATIYKVSSSSNLDYIIKLILDGKNVIISNIDKCNNYKEELEYFRYGDRIKENIVDKNQISIGRSIISKTSINLVRIALNSNSIKDFYNELSNTMDLVRNELLQTFEYKSNKYKENFKYSYSNEITLDSEKLENGGRIRKVIKNGVLSIGYSGLKETLLILINRFNNKDKIELNDINIAIDILKFMKGKCDSYTSEFKLNFYLSETYEKDVLKEFLSLDKSIYGIIKNITNKDSYSTFSRIFKEIDISVNDRFKIEKEISNYSNGGYYENIILNKNCSYKRLNDIINSAIKEKINFMKFEFGDSYDN